LFSLTKRLMAAWRSTTERRTPRLRRRLVSLAKDELARRYLRLNRVEEVDELMMPTALHIVTDDSAVEDVERGE